MVTEFTDHICVTMDAELIMFLHDLVSAYLKEKEKGFCPVALQKTAPRLRFHAAWSHVGERREMREAEYYFHTRWGGHGARCQQHFNGSAFCGKATNQHSVRGQPRILGDN